jgi:glycosyltransferase involved in cell wall biosynthesis
VVPLLKPLPPVLLVTAPAAFGGLERVVTALAGGLSARGHDIGVLALLDVRVTGHPLVHELTDAGVRVRTVEVAPRKYGVERAALSRVVGETGARIVHTHGTRVDVVDGPAAQRLGLAWVSTLHGFTGGGWKNRLYEWLQVRAVRRCDAVVAVSQPMAEGLRHSGVAAERLHLIPNAWSPRGAPRPRVEARDVLGLPADGFRVGWVGRLTPEKGADVMLESLLWLRDLPLGVSVVGAGRQSATLQERARAKGLSQVITWHGAVPDADRVMTAFDVLVLSSRTEGTPIVLFEAMAAGTPIVATAVGGIPDVLTDQEALLVPPERPDALATAIRTVFADPGGAAVRARVARASLARRFGTEPWLDAYEDLYLAVAGGTRGREPA